jgi:hypothetical protein
MSDKTTPGTSFFRCPSIWRDDIFPAFRRILQYSFMYTHVPNEPLARCSSSTLSLKNNWHCPCLASAMEGRTARTDLTSTRCAVRSPPLCLLITSLFVCLLSFFISLLVFARFVLFLFCFVFLFYSQPVKELSHKMPRGPFLPTYNYTVSISLSVFPSIFCWCHVDIWCGKAKTRRTVRRLLWP